MWSCFSAIAQRFEDEDNKDLWNVNNITYFIHCAITQKQNPITTKTSALRAENKNITTASQTHAHNRLTLTWAKHFKTMFYDNLAQNM
jgi:hypothetical protein